MPFRVAHSPEEWLSQFGANPPRTTLTIGNFDGVHLGHRKILREVLERARASGMLACVVTFDPHPVKILRPAEAPVLISSPAERLERFAESGLEAALVLRFDSALSNLSPEEFARRILVETLRASAVVVGENFRFGHKQAGDVRRLTELGRELGFKVECVPPVVVRGRVISSSAIRQAIREGKIDLAGRWLGRPFALRGKIRPGTGQGRRLVVPTLNLSTDQELLPASGVYATESVVAEAWHRSATNVGFRPTFDGKKLTIESHLFDFHEELRSGPMEVRFWIRLRNERKFPGPEALRAQIMIDLARARAFFRRLDRSRSAQLPA